MPSFRALATPLFLALLVMLGLPHSGEGQPSPAFLETFDGDPVSPQPWHPADWDVQVHSRDTNRWLALDPMSPQHGPDCAPPMATHGPTTAYEDAVFLCRDHLMTAINAGGYGLVYLTPPAMLDFSQGEAVLRFDISTLQTSTRDWWDLWLSPPADEMAIPLDSWLPDAQGPPARAIQVRLDGGTFRAARYSGGAEQALSTQWWVKLADKVAPSATVRTPFELRVSATRIKFGLVGGTFWWLDAVLADLGWDKAVVQLGHHSYNPTKDCPAGATCTPNTWHWDNVSLSPSVPLSIIRPDRRYVEQANAATPLTFAQPAPAGSYLRLSGLATNPQISADGGVSWQSAAAVAPNGQSRWGGVRSYRAPLPVGAQSILVKATTPPDAARWHLKDFSIFGLAGNTPTSTPTLAPSPTGTPSPSATPMSTPNPACEVWTRFGGVESWVPAPLSVCGR